MLRTLTISISLLLVAATADAGEHLVALYGVGGQLCKDLSHSFEQKADNRCLEWHGATHCPESTLYREWLSGYVTAYSTVGPPGSRLTDGIEIADALSWVRRYCAQNPTDRVSRAAHAFVVSQPNGSALK